MLLIIFSCLIALTNTSSSMNGSHPCLVSIPNRHTSRASFRTEVYVFFIMLRKYPSIPIFWRVLIRKGELNYIMTL